MTVSGHTSAQTVAEMAALGKMLHEHRPALLAMLERRIDPKLASRMNAEDLLSEAFLEARRKWDWFKDQSELSPYVWLYRICLDTIIAAWRRESRSRARFSEQGMSGCLCRSKTKTMGGHPFLLPLARPP